MSSSSINHNKSIKFIVISLLSLFLTSLSSLLDASVPSSSSSSSPLSGLLLWNISLNPPRSFAPGRDPSSQHAILYVGETPISSANETSNFLFYVYYSSTSFDVPQPYATQQPITISAINIISGKSVPWTFLVDGQYGTLRRAPYTFKLLLENGEEQFVGFFAAPPYVGAPPIPSQSEGTWNLFSLDAESGDVLLNCSLPPSNIDHCSSHRIRFDFTKGILFFLTVTGVSIYNISELMAFPAPTDGITVCPGYMRTTSFDNYGYLLWANAPTEIYINESARAMFLMYTGSIVEVPQNYDICEMAGYLNGGVPWSDSTTGGMSWYPNVSDHYGVSPPLIIPASYIYQSTNVGFLWYTQYASTVFVNTGFYSATMSYKFRVPANGQVFSFSFSIPGSPDANKYPLAGWVFWCENTKSLISSESLDSAETFYIISRALPNTMNAQTTDTVQTNWKTNAPSNCPRVYSPVDDFAYNNNILNKFFRNHPSRVNGSGIMLVTCATPGGNIGIFAIRLTDGAILYNETDESLFWTGGAMGMTQSKYLQQSQQVFSAFEESQSNFGMSVVVATRKRQASSLGESEFGQILAFAPCFLFPENDPLCPSSCIAQYGACGPRSASKTLCESQYTKAVFGGDAEYYWCEALGTCVDRSVVPNCTCEYFDQFLCDKAEGSCFFCQEQGACVYQDQYPACKCDTFSERQCQNSQQSTSSCKFCSDLKACVETSQNQNCECSKLPEASCLTNAGDSCSWCPNIQYCNWKGKSCECVSFPNSSSCLAAPNSTCKWCDDPLGVCIDLSKQNKFMKNHNNFDIKPTGCSCFELDQAECYASMVGFENILNDNNNVSSCQWQQPVLVGVDNAQGYCTNSLSCPNPLTCQGLNFASDVEFSCIASGCTFNVNNNNNNNNNNEHQRSSGSCQTSVSCEYFFVSSFVSQPYILLFSGFLKDIIVLLLIGVIGDWLARRIRKYGTPFLIWWYGWPKKQINIEVDKTTVYLTDDVCRDEEQFDGISFEEYCLDVIDEIFILSPKMNKLFFNNGGGVDETNSNNYKSRQNFENNEDLNSYTLSAAAIEEQRKNVFDAVAFALSDNGFWIDLDLLKEYRRIAQLEEILEAERVQEREEMNEKHRTALMAMMGNEKNISEKEIIITPNSQKQTEQKNVPFDDDNQHDYNGATGGGYGSITDSRRDSNCSVETIPQARHSRHFVKNNNNNDNNVMSKKIAVLPIAPKRQNEVDDADGILCNKRPVFFKQSHIGEQQSLLNNFNQIKADDIQTGGADRKKMLYPIEKVTLGTVTLASKVLLQKVVTRSIQERVTSIVFYAHSRDLHRRVASSLNTFPSTLQLLFYTFSLVVMFVVAFWVVILDSTNRKKVEQVAAFTCGDRTGNQSTTNGNNYDDNSTSSQNLDGDAKSLAFAAYFILGFRLMNASTFGTFCLVFVKVIRGIYHRFFEKEGLVNLTLSQRLPLIALFSNRSIHLLLLLYAGMVFPFCWISPFYGWKFGPVVGLPFIFCLIGLAIDAFILKIARSIMSDHANGSKQSVTDYSQQSEADYLDHEEDGQDSTKMSGSAAGNNCDGGHQQENSAPSLSRSRESALTGISRGSKRGNASMSHSASLVPRKIEHDREEARSISSSTPLTIGRALIVFLLSEEIPTILLTVSLQVGFNYVSFLEYQDSFGVTTETVARRDFDSRKIECVYQIMMQDVSGFFSSMSSLIAFW